MSSLKIINFAKATKKIVLEELEIAFKNSQGCAPPEIPYALFKRAIDSGVGEIVSPFRINSPIEHPTPNERYVHSVLVNDILSGGANFRCYTHRPINKKGNFIEPSQLPKDPCNWPKSNI
ncbi:MAG: hypothetical protein Q8N63_02240 [Nanoarchaeota archaeon]|nr:hypothetical protein [Nanoarchaeota archaeon]